MAALVLASCGGGGTSSVQPATTFRTNVPGDGWNYNVETINFGVFGSYSGTLNESLSNDTYNGAASIRYTRTFQLTLQSGPATITSYEEISPEGALLAESDANGLSAVVSNTFNVPSPLTRTSSSSGVVKLADGTTFTINWQVTGAEQMVTSAGLFNCWVVKENVVHSDTTTDAYTMWIAPETGNYVRIQDQTVNPDGSGYKYLASLTSIVTPPAAGVARRSPGIPFLPPL